MINFVLSILSPLTKSGQVIYHYLSQSVIASHI